MRFSRVGFLVLLVSVALPLAALGDEEHHHASAGDLSQLGKVHFVTSCSPAVQARFDRGVALLHSFWYEEAEKQFKEVEVADPRCAMAHWGEAMSLWHELWERPKEETLQRGSEGLRKAQAAPETSERERAYIAALQQFYGDSKVDFWTRANAYSQAMEKVYRAYPKDTEAAAFYALSLLASERPDDSTLANRKKAIPILATLFKAEPRHPGLAHYLIHACDVPQLASMALTAAREYAKIAPSSPHAVHMPSHIFARMGLWQEDIASNLASVAATERASAMHMGGDAHKLHAMDFLEYAYLQIGNDVKAKEIVDRVHVMHEGDPNDPLHGYLAGAQVSFPATYFIETRDWKSALALVPPSSAKPTIATEAVWANAVAAGHLRDAAAGKRALEQYDKLVEEIKNSKDAYMLEFAGDEHDEVRAWAAFAQGNDDEAVRLLRAVADHQDAVGKGETEIPGREMLADMLLAMNRTQDALAEYEKSLKTDPNRFNGLYGAAQAAEHTGDAQLASRYYGQLVKNCANSHSDRPELARARDVIVAQK
jgi:tetratricopeptide (TPR) repeat protein